MMSERSIDKIGDLFFAGFIFAESWTKVKFDIFFRFGIHSCGLWLKYGVFASAERLLLRNGAEWFTGGA